MRSTLFKTSNLLFIGAVFLFSSCLKEKHKMTRTYKINQPIYASHDVWRNGVQMEPSRTLKNPGKIYSYGDLLLINEKEAGIHLFDNSNPTSPQAMGFIKIPGNVDMAMKNGILYADSYTDLLALNVSSPGSVEILNRNKDVFEHPYFNFDYDPNYPLGYIDNEKGVVIGWKVEEITETCEDGDCQDLYYNGPIWLGGPMVLEDGAINMASAMGGGSNLPPAGVAGSQARMMVYDNVLYAIVNHGAIKVFNISSESNPTFESDVFVGWNIETLFTSGTNLFIGSQSGMYIYDLNDPANPAYISELLHVRSCDPVVVYGKYAYVTLRGGTECGGFTNQLDVIDISQLDNPALLKSYPMEGPYGLGIDGEKEALFICDGDAGLKIYDASNPLEIDANMLSHFADLNAYDVIPLGKTLMMIGDDGFYQYDYSNLNAITEISRIPVVR